MAFLRFQQTPMEVLFIGERAARIRVTARSSLVDTDHG
jgi:hypothetical protein